MRLLIEQFKDPGACGEPLLNYIVEDKYTSESLEEYQKNFQSNIAAD